MNDKEAKEYAQNMSYDSAIFNISQAKSIPYKKATLTKLHEMANKVQSIKNDYDNIANPINDMTMKISMQVTEDIDNFIFESIKPWCEEKTQMKISKKELQQALMFWRNKDKMLSEIEQEAYGEHIDGADVDDVLIVELNDVKDVLRKYIREV